jgi:dipeptidyl aminopeptidase/acylaminoacyl peptidase
MTLPDLIPLEVLFGNPERTSPRPSPDGSQLAFLAPDEGVLNVWLGPADDPAAARAITKDRVRGIRSLWWSYDGRHLIYLQDTGGDENWRIHVVDVASGEDADATPFAGVQAQIAGASMRVPGALAVALNKDDPRWHDLYRLDLDTLELTLLAKCDGFDGWIVDEDLEARGAIRPRADGGQTYVRRSPDGSGAWEPFLEVEPDDVVINVTGPLGWNEDGSKVYLSSAVGTDKARLTLLDPETGEEEVLAEHPDNDIDPFLGVGTFVFDPETAKPLVVSFATPRREYLVVDPSLEEEWEQITAIREGEPFVAGPAFRTAWVVGFVVDDGPVEYYRWDRSSREATHLFSNQPALEGLPLAHTEPFSFTSRDGLTVHGLITFPVGVERTNLPAVLEVHGGPWGARHVWGFLPTAQWLANRGYVCINIDYRGSGGYGKAFLNASAQEWAGKMHDDLLDAVQWAIAEKITTPDKVAIYGGSYGGYATLVGLTFTPDTFACGVDIVGPSNLNTLLASIPPYWKSFFEEFASRVGDPRTAEGQKLLADRSPITHVSAIKKPLLIAQGANDPRVKQAESDQIVKAMKDKKLPVTYVLYPEEGHGFARPTNRTSFYAIAEGFLSECLGGRYEPIGNDFKGANLKVLEGANHVPGLTDALK